ncbi:MAG: hypothetical protein AAGD32_16035 [Planctomycetota bacterium]
MTCEVGPLPVEIDPVLDANFKLVNSGGAPDGWSSSSFVQAVVFETPDPVDNGFLGPIVTREDTFANQDGNGFLVVDATVDSEGPFVLVPGLQYRMDVTFATSWDTTGLGIDDPTAAVFLEAGGISGFDGVSVDLNARVVPEPALMSVFAGAGLLLLRRR